MTHCPEDGAALRADETRAGERAAPTAALADPLAGRVLDEKYRLEERLGEGGMGAVYRATHLLIERQVAVKVLSPRLVSDEAARERLRREARAAGRLQHANAVSVTDVGETKDGLVYVVMELLEGRPLRELIAREAPFDPARAVSVMLQVAGAVGAAHEAGVIHRDLKPGNIFVVQRPHAPHVVKVLDFGIAKVGEDATGNPVDTLTGTGVMIGTPRYMSPEQCDGGRVTPASDVYSLGVILYEMLTGQTPFSGATPLALALKHSSEAPRRPTEIVPTIPPALEAVALHALEKSAEERPGDAEEFRRELLDVAERLGLEHSAGFGTPTLESLRDAGTETPSGRLVIDLERLRQNLAATREQPAVFDTAAADLGRDTDAGRPRDAPQARRSDTPPGRPRGEAHGGGGRRRLRVRVPTRAGVGASLRRPEVVAVALGAVVLGAAVYLFLFRGRAPRADAGAQAALRDEAIGRTLASADVTPRQRPAVTEPRSAAEFYERGAYNFSSRNFEGAARDYRRALELQPEFPEAHNRLGRALLMQGRLNDAADEFRKAVEQKGGSYAAAQYNLGFALQQLGRQDEAIEAYQGAVASSGGTYPDAFFQIGLAHFNRRRYAEAAEALRRAVEQNGGRDPEAHNTLGVALSLTDDFAGAEAAFHAAIAARGGDYPEAHFNLGMHYAQTGRIEEAVREMEVFLMQEPEGERRRNGEAALRELRRKLRREGTVDSGGRDGRESGGDRVLPGR